MDPVTSEAIDLIEAAYDLDKSESAWLPNMVEAGAGFLDKGQGFFAFPFVQPSPAGGGAEVVLGDAHLHSVPPDLLSRYDAARNLIPPKLFREFVPAGYAGTWTEATRRYPELQQGFLDLVGYPDLLGVIACDLEGAGVHIVSPLRDVVSLNAKTRTRWKMIGAHIASAYRLRRASAGLIDSIDADSGGLPHGAEAVLDAGGLRLIEARGRAQAPRAGDALRRAARLVDRARGSMKQSDPAKALETWKALVYGRWSVVDWFDTDGRRFVLAKPNPPKVYDPRGLSEQECQVVTYVLLGDTNKLIAYRLGLSQGRVSVLLKSAMHKLGAKSKAQLVQKLGPLGVPSFANGALVA